MAQSAVADPPAPPSNLNLAAADYELEEALSIPPLEHDQLLQNDDVLMAEEFDFDFSFDDFFAGNSLGDGFLQVPIDPVEPDLVQPGPVCFEQIGDFENCARVFKSSSSELHHFNSDYVTGEVEILNQSSPELSSSCSRVLLSNSPESNGDVSGYLNVPSPESNGSNREAGNDNQDSSGGDVVLHCPSPDSNGSGNASAAPNLLSMESDKSVSSSTDFCIDSITNCVVDQKIKLEDVNANVKKCSSPVLKRKKQSESEDNSNSNNSNSNEECRTSKFRKPVEDKENNSDDNNGNVMNEEEEKRKTRLMRNRESAQLSRQRKKHYVEELEDKVRTMHSTIQDLNAKITYIMAENTSLRQQMGGNGVGVTPPMPPPPGMYPPVMYPWMPCAPPYMVKPQGSQVPLVPIPRLKPQQTASAPKSSKKSEGKKSEAKTKKVASISFLGLLFFMLIFGGLAPMVNVRYGGMKEAFTGSSYYSENGYYERHHGRVLSGNETRYGESYGHGKHLSNATHFGEKDTDEVVQSGNGSVPLAASLYVPRNDKLVKIDGNLIIHSVLASEKAMASHGSAKEKESQETGLAVPENMAAIASGRHPHLYQGAAERQRALGSDSMGKDNMRSTGADGRLQQWFREGLAGPMLSSGMCTEVFQFDVSSAIVPASAMRNVSLDEQNQQTQNTTTSKKGRNRRILHGLSVPLPSSSSHNISEKTAEINGKEEKLKGNDSLSSMVVSVLFDPREGGDGEGEGMMGKKSLSRIFVVVLVDSVKYVTYSCVLPFKGSVPHLVTT